jgi:hypothetical protein
LWGHPHTSASPSSLNNAPTVWLQLLLRCTNSPFLGHQQTALSASTSESHYASHACQLTNGRAGWPPNFCIKEGSSGSEHLFIQRSHQVRSTSRQEGRNYYRLPGHDASWTGHYIAQQNTTPDCSATTSRRPGTTRLGRVRYLAAHSPATTPAAAPAIHRGPTTSQPRIQSTSSPATI